MCTLVAGESKALPTSVRGRSEGELRCDDHFVFRAMAAVSGSLLSRLLRDAAKRHFPFLWISGEYTSETSIPNIW